MPGPPSPRPPAGRPRPASGPGATGGHAPPGYRIRTATAADRDAVLAVASRALGWDPAEPNDALFRWKHLENPFGASPAWLAEHDGEVVAFRTFMHWEFVSPWGPRRAVRAVDTATVPEHQRRGLFRALTLAAVDELRVEGIDFVFNTPNASSRPGYLAMGWQQLGRVPVAAAVPRWRRAAALAGARVAASKWSEDVAVGSPAAEVLDDRRGVAALLAALPEPRGLRTHRDPAFLAWRYGLDDLHYRALVRTNRVEDGVVVFRVRRRGSALECTVCDLLVPGGEPRAERELLRRLRSAVDADFVLRVQRAPWRDRFARVPGVGPVLTWRAVCDARPPGIDDWDLVLGDVELF